MQNRCVRIPDRQRATAMMNMEYFTLLEVFFEAFHLKQERTGTDHIKRSVSKTRVGKHISCPAPYRHAPVFVGRVCNLNDVPQTDLGENLGVDHQLVICLEEEFDYNHTSSFQ